MTGTHNNKAGNYRVLTILSLLSTCGAAVYFIAPLLVGGYVTQLGFSSQQGGYIISAELAGFAVAPIPAAIWVRRINWRTALYLAAGSIILMNLITSSLTGFSLFFGWLLCKRLQGEILRRESRTRWVRNLVAEAAA